MGTSLQNSGFRLETKAGDSAAVSKDMEQLAAEVGRLRAENRTLSRELKHLRETAHVAVSDVDTQAFAKGIARQAALMLNAERAIVGIVEYEALVVQAHWWNAESQGHVPGVFHYPVELSPGTGCGLAPWVVLNQQPYICADARVDPNLGSEYAAEYKCRNAMCVPILNHQNAVLGFIEVQNRRDPGTFSQDDVRAAEVLALQAAVGFQRSRLIDRLAEWTQSMEMLLAFNAAVNQHLEPAMLIRRLVENAARFLKADGGLAGLAVPGGAVGLCMLSDSYWSRGQWHEQQRRWEAGHGLAGFMLDSQFPYLSNDYPRERLADQSMVREFNVRQALCVPIKDAEDNVIGFFELHKYTPQTPFTWQDVAFLESLANVTAVSIRNAQLLKSVEIKNREIQTLSAYHVTRIEEERQHIARELHDEAGQMLIGIKLGLQVLSQRVPEELMDLRTELDDLREQVNTSTTQLKNLAGILRPPTLDKLGLEVALRQLASEFQQRANLAILLDLESLSPRLSQAKEIALYRIAQEALTNVARHSQAGKARLALLQTESHVELIISDDGKGFDLQSTGKGLGLLGMKERVGMLDGELVLRSSPQEGTRIQVRVPHACP